MVDKTERTLLLMDLKKDLSRLAYDKLNLMYLQFLRNEVDNKLQKGYKSTPSFYLNSGQNCFRVDCGVDDIKVLPITETHKMDTYMRDNCYCISSQASCWAVAIYYTKEPDKPPFDEM